MTRRKNPDLVSVNLGIIAGRCLHHWRYLPPRVRATYDLDDMIGDVVLHVHCKSVLYDPGRGKASTWVWWVAENKCLLVRSHYRAYKRAACETVEMTEELAAYHMLSVAGAERTRLACDAVEKVIDGASPGARGLLECLLCGTQRGRRKEPALCYVAELRTLVRAARCTLDDFKLVQHALAV